MKRIASLSLDLDNKWCYLQMKGDKDWQGYPSYLTEFVPRMLEFFKNRGTQITFFIVGQDAALDINRDPLTAIHEAGHEIGNHSFRHQPWLHLYSLDEMREEIDRAEEAIGKISGSAPKIFRGPGYSYTQNTLRVLQEKGYRYDCSSFPNSMNGLARLYFFHGNKLSEGDRKQRKELFGPSTEAFKPLKPYRWNLEGGELLEIPVTTMPLFRFPIHFSYILYLSRYSERLALSYFGFAMWLCSVRGVEPSMLFHPLDFIGSDDNCPELSFFPAMDIPAETKLRILDGCLDIMERRFKLVPMGAHAAKHEEVPSMAAP